MEKGKALNKALSVAVSATMAVSLGAPIAWADESADQDPAAKSVSADQSTTQTERDLQAMIQQSANGSAAGATENSPLSSDNSEDNASVAAAVAQGADGATYASLQDAVNNAPAGSAVTLMADTTENVTVPAEANFTLDLAGHTLSGGTAKSKAALTNNGTLVVKDSSGNDSGRIVREDNGASGYYTIDNQGTMTIESGSVYNQTGPMPKGSSLIRNAGVKDAATLTITGGHIKQDGFIAVKNDDHGILNVTGGIVEATGEVPDHTASAVQNWCEANITGGTINGAVWTGTWTDDLPASVTTIDGDAVVTGKIISRQEGTGFAAAPTINIKGGTINVKDAGWQVVSPAVAAVSGGTFDSAVPADYCAEGYAPVQNADGTFGVSIENAVASVGDARYATLQAAVDAAPAGSTVTVLADIDLAAPVAVTKRVTLDLDGHMLFNTKDIWNDKVAPKLLSLITVRENGDLTITGNGTLQAKENDCYAVMCEAENAKLTVESGTFVGNVSAVYVVKGSANLEGGTYKLLQKNTNTGEKPYDPNRYLINCFDANFNGGTANIVISGGTYEGFDPTKSPEKDSPSLLAPGMKAEADANGNFTVSAAGVALVGETAYSTLADAVAAAQPGQTVKLIADSNETVSVTKQLNFTAAEGVVFSGQLKFENTYAGGKKTSSPDGSTVKGMTFMQKAPLAADANVRIQSANNIEVSDNVFTIDSSATGQVNSIIIASWGTDESWAGAASGNKVLNNTFDMQLAAENSAVSVNLQGSAVDSVEMAGNTVHVTNPAGSTHNAFFLISIGTNGSMKDLVLKDNSFEADDAAKAGANFAGIANSESMTVTGNKITNANQGVGVTSWQGQTSPNSDINFSGNTYTNVKAPVTLKSPDGDQTPSKYSGALLAQGATVTDFATLDEAVAAAKDGDTVTLLGSTDENATINKAITVTSLAGDDATARPVYTGTMTVTAGATVTNLAFELDPAVNANAQNLIVNSKANGAQITDNTFTIKTGKAANKWQPSSVWLQGGVTNTNVSNNTFNIGQVWDESAVGVNLVGGSDVIDGTVIKGNTVVSGPKYSEGDGDSGSMMFVVANGNLDPNQGQYGITNITFAGNTVDGTNAPSTGTYAPSKTYGISIADVNGLVATGNTFTKNYIGISYSTYDMAKVHSTGIEVNANTFIDNLATVYFKNGATQLIDAKDITYGAGDNANTYGTSGYAPKAPIMPTASGQAFAGWYADEALTIPATDANAPAYAKWVDAYDGDLDADYTGVMSFAGGSLRMDKYVLPDGGYDTSHADLRLGFKLKLPEGATIERADGAYGWKYGLTDEVKLSSDGKAIADAEPDADGTYTVNLVVTNAPVAKFDAPVFAQMHVTYTTADGTKTTATYGETDSRSVNQVVKAIQNSDKASAVEKAYADALSEAYASQSDGK